jgi:putative oxidoreductase
MAIGVLMTTVLRIFVGLLFAGHGAQKLFGWFGGHGFEAHTQMTEKMGFHPVLFWALVSSLSEFVGGLLLAFGLFTPIAAALIIGTMVVAIAKVHWAKGFWVTNGGYEFNLVLILTALVFGFNGPGPYALDAMLTLPWSNVVLFTVSLAIVLIGAVIGVTSSMTQAGDAPSKSNYQSR